MTDQWWWSSNYSNSYLRSCRKSGSGSVFRTGNKTSEMMTTTQLYFFNLLFLAVRKT